MKRFSPCIVVTLSVLSLASSASASVLAAAAKTQYQSITGAPGLDVAIDPAPLTPVYAASLSSPGEAFNAGYAWAAAAALPTGGAAFGYSRASGFSPGFGPPDEVKAESYAIDVSSWEPTSDTLEAGTQIWVAAVLSYHGTLGAANYFGQGVDRVTASAESSLKWNDSVTLFEGSAKVDAQTTGGGAPVLTTTGGWDNDFVPTTIDTGGLGDTEGYELSTLEVAFFPAWIGSPFRLDFDLRTKAFAEGPFEAFGQADFGSSAYYSLLAIGQRGVTFVDRPIAIAPEPATLVLLGLTALLPLGRRRRQ